MIADIGELRSFTGYPVFSAPFPIPFDVLGFDRSELIVAEEPSKILADDRRVLTGMIGFFLTALGCDFDALGKFLSNVSEPLSGNAEPSFGQSGVLIVDGLSQLFGFDWILGSKGDPLLALTSD
ncbi:MAG: hypothetical protein ABJM29_16155 [Rhizobiaceae bacterium]